MRGEKKTTKWTMFITIASLFVVLIFAVNTIQSRFIYSDRMIQLTTYFSQLESVISTRFTRYFKILKSWSYHLEHEESSGIGNFQNYIYTEKRIWEVEEAYLFDKEGSFIAVDNSLGKLDANDGMIEKLQDIGSRQVTHISGKDGKRMDLFVLSVKPGTYEGFNYCAIGLSLDSKQMKNRLTILRDDMEGSQNYLVDKTGNLIVTSVPIEDEKSNIIEFIKKEGEVIYDPLGEGFEIEISKRMTGVIVMTIEHVDYYITFMPCEIMESMLVCLTPVEVVDKSIAHVKNINNILLIVAFGIVMVIIILLMRYNSMQNMLEVANSANETKTRFLANMSHDFRTPMNAMGGFITLMMENADNKDKVREYGEKAQYTHRNMLNMINCILDLSKMEEGGEEIIHERFSLDELLMEVKRDIEPDAEQKKQTLSISRGEVRVDALIGDKQRVKIVLENLLHNAVSFTEDNGKIELLVYRDNEENDDRIQLRFEVTDNGIGIGSDFIEKIYEPFMREQRAVSSKEQGTGLGLTVVKKIIEMLGGTIDVESSVGVGTTVTVYLGFDIAGRTELEEMRELGETLKEGNSQKDITEEKNIFEGMRFLAAEDNELNAEILKEILMLKKASLVDVAQDGKKAVEAFLEKPKGYYDMILMDIQMPGMDGYEAARTIRSLKEQGREDAGSIPIVAMSANAFRDDIDNTSKAGMDAHIPKPIDIKLFESTVRALQARRHKEL